MVLGYRRRPPCATSHTPAARLLAGDSLVRDAETGMSARHRHGAGPWRVCAGGLADIRQTSGMSCHVRFPMRDRRRAERRQPSARPRPIRKIAALRQRGDMHSPNQQTPAATPVIHSPHESRPVSPTGKPQTPAVEWVSGRCRRTPRLRRNRSQGRRRCGRRGRRPSCHRAGRRRRCESRRSKS